MPKKNEELNAGTLRSLAFALDALRRGTYDPDYVRADGQPARNRWPEEGLHDILAFALEVQNASVPAVLQAAKPKAPAKKAAKKGKVRR